MKAIAIWKGQVVAESDETIIIESNHYFPRNSIAGDSCVLAWRSSNDMNDINAHINGRCSLTLCESAEPGFLL